ncbi:hypothetical protein BpHYR1_001063 [Brachionus plicatilis]|uniref:Uncharacterized protein n=1 Tax=Brachionus plicatilis TaxID=10195 RepID=A0A3M7RR97_BRAPC|nr:hypothetical protein BpHYR1_001063 [Brachionus plicatilis]
MTRFGASSVKEYNLLKINEYAIVFLSNSLYIFKKKEKNPSLQLSDLHPFGILMMFFMTLPSIYLMFLNRAQYKYFLIKFFFKHYLGLLYLNIKRAQMKTKRHSDIVQTI